MAEEFTIERDVPTSGAVTQAWYSVTDGLAGWLFPTDIEHREGGSAAGGTATVTQWQPESRVATRSEGPEGWFNELEFTLSHIEGGVNLHYVHRGILPAPGALEGIELHTDFYLDAYRRTVEEFPQEKAVFASADAGEWGTHEHALDAVLAFLDASERREGDRVSLNGESAIIDWSDENFLGLRTTTAMWRFFARNRFGGVLSLVIHDFSPQAEAEATTLRASEFLRAVGITAQ